MAFPKNIPDFAGLKWQTKGQLNVNDWGVAEITRSALLKNSEFPASVPAKDADDPVYGNKLSKTTHRFTESGKAAGVGILECVFKGAFIEAGGFTAEYLVDGLSRDYVTLDYYHLQQNSSNDLVYIKTGTAKIDYNTVNYTYRYVAADKPDSPRFYDAVLAAAQSGDDPTALPTIIGDVYVVPIDIDTTPGDEGAAAPFKISKEDLNRIIDVDVVLSDFQRPPCGTKFEVTETFTIKFKQKVPTN